MTEQANLRMTKQRQIILEELANLKSHPTAAELCMLVRKKLPHISLGTVYRNLDILSKRGDINKIDVGGEEKRFDATTDNHYHLRCLTCGRVEDVELPVFDGLEKQVANLCQAKVLGHNLEFVGYCKHCC